MHCSLIAPSDQELMGGNKGSGSGGGDAGRSDAMDGSSGGGSGGSSSGGGQCNHTGDCCASTSDCCSGLACEPNSGVCIPCTQSGQSCFGGVEQHVLQRIVRRPRVPVSQGHQRIAVTGAGGGEAGAASAK